MQRRSFMNKAPLHEASLGSSQSRRALGKLRLRRLGNVLLAACLCGAAVAQSGPLVLERAHGVISLEPYAPNILRVTMSTDQAGATATPGYGFIAKASA